MNEDGYLDSFWEDRNEMLAGWDDDGWDDRPGVVFDEDDEWDDHPTIDDEDLSDEPPGMTDVEADADTLASAGWGMDEDYGYFGDYND